MTVSNFLATILEFLHLLIVTVIITIPFIKTTPAIYFLHIFFGLSIVLHWKYNNDICSLSVLEASLRGVNYTESYTHSIISRIYNIPHKKWTTICYLIVIMLICISFYKIISSENLKVAKKYFNRHKQKIIKRQKKENLSIKEYLKLLIKCVPFMITNKYNNIDF